MNKFDKTEDLQHQAKYKMRFDQVYRDHFGRLFFFANTLTKSEDLAKDIVSDVFVNFWNARINFDKIRDIESYLFISVKNQTIQAISRYPQGMVSIDIEDAIKEIDKTNPEDVLLEKELLNALEDAIHSLPDQCQLVFTLARDQNMTYQQIANELGIAPATVKSHMIKAIADIRIFITDRYDDSKKTRYMTGLVLALVGLDLLISTAETSC